MSDEFSKTGHKHKGIDEPRISYNDLSDLPNASTASPTHMLIHSRASTMDGYIQGFAFTTDWTKLYFSGNGGAKVITIFRNPGGDKTAEFLSVFDSSTTPDPKYICYHPTADKILAAANSANNTIYIYNADNTVSGETLATISGTASTNIQGLTADANYVYVFDGGTSTVRRYTLSGTTLTYVDAITLGDASAKNHLAVDSNYLFSYDSTNNIYWTFNKTTGATISSFNTNPNAGSDRRGLCVDPDGNLRQLISYADNAGTSIVFYLTKLSLN